MHAIELWSTLSPALNHEILETAYLNEKKLYRRVVDDIAANLRKRPKMILEMPRQARHELFRPLLQLPGFHIITQNLLIHWLATTQTALMNAFLDGLAIKHDGAGSVDAFPESVDKAKLAGTVQKLYADFEEEKVTAYLSVFDSISGVKWPDLEPLIKKALEAV
jgi:hypothetical protein